MKSNDGQEMNAAERLVEAAGERAKSCVDVSVAALEAASEKVVRAGQDARNRVRENPWIAIGTAAGVGVVVGYLLGHRRGS